MLLKGKIISFIIQFIKIKFILSKFKSNKSDKYNIKSIKLSNELFISVIIL